MSNSWRVSFSIIIVIYISQPTKRSTISIYLITRCPIRFSPAINRASSDSGYTNVNIGNPANASGKITSVEIWANTILFDCKVGIFYVVSGNILSTRDWVQIGTVTAGAKKTFEVDLEVEEGDYIGICQEGDIEYDTSGYAPVSL
ncbi:hypothetical protein ES708_34140 [subsurface metagenome]